MRLKGEQFGAEGEEEEEQKLVVGYALTLKKKKSFLQPEFERLACKRGISFVAIDVNRPLSDQGPFDIILHKDYGQTHPEVAVIDPPDAIQHVYNRHSMLQNVVDLNLSEFDGRVCVPRQMVIMKDQLSIPDEAAKAGLKLPLVAKPLLVDGSAKSHELFLLYDWSSLSKLEPPFVLQEFVNHGGILFKIYNVGDAIKVVRRYSLPNVTKCQLADVPGIFPFPRVSSAAASADDADLDPDIAELPPLPLLERLSKELRHRLGLRLFNIDMIREHGTRDIFYVIDINYFPGYGKIPDYEAIFTDFLLTFMKSKYRKKLC
ncbi:inositol-tetrakisphosphate 1-kinase 2-like isoform X2 [Hibiscus syriacus]|uniref:inositol-tetrakisphosphate 1-kinase 2-like isoform X2 n=1 Tax=Hibiscus syriacus TaxID=106335 RepID=UPI001920EAFD|nr:inositol-tetrakisphosphate 1-kinase 2-like isoform X2 [Hibiscus syriacus]